MALSLSPTFGQTVRYCPWTRQSLLLGEVCLVFVCETTRPETTRQGWVFRTSPKSADEVFPWKKSWHLKPERHGIRLCLHDPISSKSETSPGDAPLAHYSARKRLEFQCMAVNHLGLCIASSPGPLTPDTVKISAKRHQRAAGATIDSKFWRSCDNSGGQTWIFESVECFFGQ